MGSCSKDFYDEIKLSNNSKQMRYLNKNEVLSIPKIVAKLNKFRNVENRSTDRVVQSNVYNFYVNTQSALYIKNDNQETYTFEVKRDVCDGKVENLVLVSMPDNSFRVLLVKYYFTYAEKESTGFNPANYPNPTYTEIDFNYEDLLSKCEYKTDYICVESYEYSCDIPTNQGNNVGGAPIYTCGWSVTAASCYLLMTSSGCNGGENSGLTNFTTGPVTTSQGYYADGINLTLTPKQRLFMNALNLIGKDNFSALDGGVQLNIFNFIEGNSSANSSTVANFINSNSMSWITIQEVATQQSIFNYLIQNNFSSQSKDLINNLMNLLDNNSNYELVPFNSGNAMNFQTFTEFNSFLNQCNNTTMNNNITNIIDNGVQISSSKIIDISELHSVKFDVVANKSPFSLDSSQCNSYLTNFLLGNSWVQSNIALISLNSTYATIKVRGYILVGFNIGNGSNGDIGIKIRKKVTFNMDTSTGQIFGTIVQQD